MQDMSTISPEALVASYLSVWNEPDETRRRTLVAGTFTEDATYGDPLASAAGHDGIVTLVGAVQERFKGLRFKPAGKVDAYGERLRFSWTLGPASGAEVAGGTDFATIEDGRLASVVGFLDFVPG